MQHFRALRGPVVYDGGEARRVIFVQAREGAFVRRDGVTEVEIEPEAFELNVLEVIREDVPGHPVTMIEEMESIGYEVSDDHPAFDELDRALEGEPVFEIGAFLGVLANR